MATPANTALLATHVNLPAFAVLDTSSGSPVHDLLAPFGLGDGCVCVRAADGAPRLPATMCAAVGLGLTKRLLACQPSVYASLFEDGTGHATLPELCHALSVSATDSLLGSDLSTGMQYDIIMVLCGRLNRRLIMFREDLAKDPDALDRVTVLPLLTPPPSAPQTSPSSGDGAGSSSTMQQAVLLHHLLLDSSPVGAVNEFRTLLIQPAGHDGEAVLLTRMDALIKACRQLVARGGAVTGGRLLAAVHAWHTRGSTLAS